MKLLAALIMTASLVVGLIASVTTYVPKLDAIDPEAGLTLNAQAGVDPDNPNQPRLNPEEADGDLVLTAELIEQLKSDGEERVRVKEFAWTRWEHRWLFVGAVVGLFVGAMMMRAASKAATSAAALASGEPKRSPAALLDAARDRIAALQSELSQITDRRARLALIIERLDAVHDEQLDPFVSARDELIARDGMTGYAQIMDVFAAAERQLNRAWSAAADGVYEEAEECLTAGAKLLSQTRERI